MILYAAVFYDILLYMDNKTKFLIMRLTPEQHKALKVVAAERGSNIKAIVIDALVNAGLLCGEKE